MEIELTRFLTKGVASVNVDGKRELWVYARSRRAFSCFLCRGAGKVGHWCWWTTSNAVHRMQRVCGTCWAGAL